MLPELPPTWAEMHFFYIKNRSRTANGDTSERPGFFPSLSAVWQACRCVKREPLRLVRSGPVRSILSACGGWTRTDSVCTDRQAGPGQVAAVREGAAAAWPRSGGLTVKASVLQTWRCPRLEREGEPRQEGGQGPLTL